MTIELTPRWIGRRRVSPLGLGCWAIGGPYTRDGSPLGWGQVDDRESERAIRAAVDAGITLFDTAPAYGCGHSERVLGRALGHDRNRVLIATKFGRVFDAQRREILATRVDPESVRSECEASLVRLNTDRIDLYQLHVGSYDPVAALVVRDVLDDLVAEGKICAYGWSTDDPERARVFAAGAHCVAVQHEMNLFAPAADMVALCEAHGLASIDRAPLAMGALAGRFSSHAVFPADDIRSVESPDRNKLARLERLRAILTARGHSLPQAALAWLWTASPRTIPIPGFRLAAQVLENVAAIEKGPLSAEQVRAAAECR